MDMNFDLKGKKALVGAATDGIGKAIAIQFAKLGTEVTLVSRNEEKLKKTLEELDHSAGQKHGYLVTDYMDFAATKAVYDDFFKENSVDILVNNTNGPKPGNVLQTSTEDFQNAFDLLFQNTIYLTQLALPKMQESKFGRIINVASKYVKEPSDYLVLSNTMRIAAASWMKTLSKMVAAENITVNTVLTGLFDTERIKHFYTSDAAKQGISVEEAKKNMLDKTPMKRAGKPEEYGYLAAFLASDLSAYLTGATIPLDGGHSDFI